MLVCHSQGLLLTTSVVCATKRLINEDDEEEFNEVYPIAGDLRTKGGKDMNAKFERLKTSTSHADSEKEGVRIEMNGGFKTLKSGTRAQKAIVEFVCDKDRDGLENLYDPEKKDDEKVERDEDHDTKGGEDPKSASLSVVRYDEGEGEVDILRMEWRTKYACEDSKGEQEAEQGNHWGFFTWFIIMFVLPICHLQNVLLILTQSNSAFLSTATYLIFGSWLNYNRYGARGWDLLPHGDTIRDVPYLFKDWMRRVLNTIQGPGSRGGYAAV